MFLMNYFILITKDVMITETLPFFPMSITTIVKETNSFNTSLIPHDRMVSYLYWLPPIKLLNSKSRGKPKPLYLH